MQETLVRIKIVKQVSLSGLCLSQINIHDEGNLKPLSVVTGARVAQIQFQEEYA